MNFRACLHSKNDGQNHAEGYKLIQAKVLLVLNKHLPQGHTLLFRFLQDKA